MRKKTIFHYHIVHIDDLADHEQNQDRVLDQKCHQNWMKVGQENDDQKDPDG